MQAAQPAVFFDKDGTLIEDRPYNVDCSKIRIARGAATAARLLHEKGYKIVVVTNQSGVAKGLFAEAELRRVESFLQRWFALHDVPLAGFYYCPHHPSGCVREYAVACHCRKPEPGLLFQAARELNLDLRSSWLVGDILDDIEAGHRAGCRAILLNNNTETEWEMRPIRRPQAIAKDLPSAAQFIIHASGADTETGDVSRVSGRAGSPA